MPGNEKNAERTETVWLISDRRDGTYMTKSGTWKGKRLAGTWSEPADAVRSLLAVDADRFGHVELLEEVRTITPNSLMASEILPPPRKTGSVPSSWLSASGSWSPRKMLDTLRIVESRKIDPMDIPSVVEVMEEITGVRRFGGR